MDAPEDGSETLQNITDEFISLMSRFHMFFRWEQLRTNLKYTEDYIASIASAVPTVDGVEQCGIPADHQGMCKSQDPYSPGLRRVIAVLKRYSKAAPLAIERRLSLDTEMLGLRRRHEAMELLR